MIERGSENMSRIGKFWTDSVAYVALVLGAGISIAGNVADTYRVRGAATDNLDLIMAALWPALVVLMVEIFVSARWVGLGRSMQVLRWAGCLSIGLMAMRVSWVHLNDLMLSRGQAEDVATLGPLAIDALAIMATALILAGRGQVDRPALTFDYPRPIGPMPAPFRVTVERTDVQPETIDLPQRQARPVATQADADETAAILADPVAYLGRTSVADEAQSYLDRLSTELDASTTPAHPIEVNPVSPAPRTSEVKPEAIPAEAKIMLAHWSLTGPDRRPTATDRNELLAAEFGVSTRTVRRWAKSIDATQAAVDAEAATA
jgi:hypothetical protein